MLANLTHFDLDGIVCNIILRNLFGKKVRYYACGYPKLQSKVEKIIADRMVFGIETIFITDLAISVEQIKQLAGTSANLFFIDHHETSFLVKKDIKKIVKNTIIDKSKCASNLVFDLFDKRIKDLGQERYDNLKRLVELTNIYDTWNTENKEFSLAYYLNSTFWLYNWNDFGERFFEGFKGLTNNEVNHAYSQLKERKQWIIEAEKTVFPVDAKNAVFIVSEHADNIVNESSFILNYDYHFVFNPSTLKISIRNRNHNKNLGIILKTLGDKDFIKSSGGHPYAGAINFNHNATQEQIENVINYIYEKFEE